MKYGCYLCAVDGMKRALFLIKLAYRHVVYAAKCCFFGVCPSRNNKVCTRYSSQKSQCLGCESSVAAFRIQNAGTSSFVMDFKDDEELLKYIQHIKHCIKFETLSPLDRKHKIHTIKWLNELQFLRQAVQRDINS